ncbi:MAG: hypothetical protein LIO85_00585 [Rikenellaceae bacterium]|nr:hypothetical protein [Rikenellaceae bacterium]
MKKLLFLIIPVLVLSSCKEDETPVPYSIYIEETSLTLVAEGETYYNRYYSYVPEMELVKPEADWIDITVEKEYLVITVERNEGLTSRTASFSLVGKPALTRTVTVTQTGRPTRVLQVSGAEANSEQTGEEIGNALVDNSDIWHSSWGENLDDYYAVFELREGSEELNIIEITPRDYGYNGRWGQVGIWVMGTVDGEIDPSASDPMDWGGTIGTTDADGYTLIMKVDFTQEGDPRSVLLPTGVLNPRKVKFHIDGKSSYGGFASLQYIRFVQIVG